MIADPGAKSLDTLLYGIAVTAATTVVCALIAFATGNGLVGLKVALFLVGFVYFSYASIRLWLNLSPPEEGEDPARPIPRDRSPFESALARVAPSVEGAVPVEKRFSPAMKLFVASLFVLGLSALMEVVFGVE